MLGSAPGIGRYIEQLTKELFQQDRTNEYILFLREPVYSRYQVPGTRFRKVRAPERWYGLAEQVTFPLRLWRAKLDLLFVPQFNVPLFVPCPFVVTIHDVTQLFMPGPLQVHSAFRRWAFRIVFGSALKRARAVIAVSEYTKNEIIKHFRADPKKLHVIYEGPGLIGLADQREIRNPRSDLPAEASAKGGIRNSFEFRDSNFEIPHGEYLLAVGVWRPHKNFTGLLDAFALLRKRDEFSSLKLVLVGEEDPRYPEVRERIAALGLRSSVLTPRVSDDTALAQWYKGARAVVVPSLYEGFGFVGLEALSFGVPVVASNTAALPEILNGAAIYFDPRDPHDMAWALARVLRDAEERRRILAAAPEILSRYSWERAARQTLEVFVKAAKRGER